MKQRLIPMLLFVCAVFVGCSSSVINNIDPPVASKLEGESLDTLFESLLPGPELPPDTIPKESICIDYSGGGLLRICYKNNTDEKLKLQVYIGKDDENSVFYNLKGDGSIEDFSLQFGEGKYTARILRNTKGTEYVVIKSKSFKSGMDDPNAAFLNSIQNVNWNYDMAPIKAVRDIVAGSLTAPKGGDLKYSCLCNLYAYIVKNVKYDNAKVFTLDYDYLPDIEKTFSDNLGICYDYSSLFAAMLHSIGIPAKLVKGYAGYAPDAYHAWNEVYVGGRWIVIDTTRDATLFAGGEEFSMEKNPEDYEIVHEY
jgi:hypothetical protein